MSPPEPNVSPSPASGRRSFWRVLLEILAGVVVLFALGWFFVVRQINASFQRHAAVRDRIAANPSGAVPLTGFVDRETQRWHSVPRGTQVCDGVTFVCDGAIRTAGLNAAGDGKRYPGAVLGLPADKRGTRIHLLQSAENTSDMTEGAAYARLVLHYANGESRRFELLFGVHGDDWLRDKSNPTEPVADPNSRVAWSQRRSGDSALIRIYHTVLENPLPKVPLTLIDFISPLSNANLLLFGLTVDDDPRPLAPSYGPGESMGDAPIRDAITFTLHDSQGHPAPTAKLAWTALALRTQIDFPFFPVNADGQVTIEVPRRIIREIQYQALASDGSNASGNIKPNPAGAFPLQPVITLTP